MKFRVKWKDGTDTEDVDNSTAMQLIAERPGEWAAVQFMEHGEGCDPENAKLREAAWGAKK
jgi:hypothetical protein